MGFSRSRTLYLVLCLALAVLSLRPVEPVDRLLDVLLAPARVFAELSAPVGWLQGRRARASDPSEAGARAADLRRYAEVERAVLDSAQPADPHRLDGVGWRHAEVVRRERGNLDRIRIRVDGRSGVEPGFPVVSADSYVGVVVERWGGQGDVPESDELVVELITSATARIGASVEGGELNGMTVELSDLVVGGLAPIRGREYLDVHNPERRGIERGRVVVNDSKELAEDLTYLANGFLLGELERVAEDGKEVLGVRPGLDYETGLYQVLVLCPGDGPVGATARRGSMLEDDGWRRARFFLRSEPSWWREGRKLSLGRIHGVERGAAVASGARFVGRVERAGLTISDVRMVGDPGLAFAALAMIRTPDGGESPHVMGRITGGGRDAEGALRFEWPATIEIPGEGCVRASVWTGSGEAGVPRGLLVGDAELPCGPGPHIIRIHQPQGAQEPGSLRVRVARGGEPVP